MRGTGLILFNTSDGGRGRFENPMWGGGGGASEFVEESVQPQSQPNCLLVSWKHQARFTYSSQANIPMTERTLTSVATAAVLLIAPPISVPSSILVTFLF